MLKVAPFFLAIGIASELVSFSDPTEALGPAPLVALVSFSLFLILLILGLPATRKLLD
jgi:hypothetical protein